MLAQSDNRFALHSQGTKDMLLKFLEKMVRTLHPCLPTPTPLLPPTLGRFDSTQDPSIMQASSTADQSQASTEDLDALMDAAQAAK